MKFRFPAYLLTLLGCLIFLAVSETNGQDLVSKMEVYSMDDSSRKVIYEEEVHFEAPNWSLDGQFFVINQDGRLYKIPVDGSSKTVIPTGEAVQCNNDHGISPDGTMLAISNNDLIPGKDSNTSRIYVLPIDGGTPQLITPLMPSYWHGWSPDGQRLVYTAERNGTYDLYEIDLATKTEIQLTDHPELDDGPEYSPDGTYVYFNSFRSGSMELWRLNKQTEKLEQLTDDKFSNWFPHPSPDGRFLVFLSYVKDQQDRHPPLKDVMLRSLDLETMEIKTLCAFFGGQGTINVPSWSPEGGKFAFVSYELK